MKRVINFFLATVLLFCVSVAFAAQQQPSTTTIKIQNNTSKTIRIDSSMSPVLIGKITFGGITGTGTPTIDIGPHSAAKLVMRNYKYSGRAIVGNLWLPVDDSYTGDQAQAIFSITVSSGGVYVNNTPVSYSNSEFAFSAIWISPSNGVVDINPATL